MANPERGEVRLEVDGTGYLLKLTLGNAIALQHKKQKPMGQLFAAVGDLDIDAIAGILWAGLQVYHGRQFRTEEAVIALMDTAGGLTELSQFIDVIGQLVNVNKSPNGSGAEVNPPPAPTGGTSESSISSEVSTPV
jgi:hypothetical protein